MNVTVENYLAAEPEKIMARHGKSFYWASQVFSKNMLKRVATLYTFCRYVDDLADECEPVVAQEQLDLVLKGLEEGKGNFSEIFGPSKIPTIYARELLDGALFDVNNGKVHTHQDLLVYCYKVAGVVGLMMTRVIGVTKEEAYAFAVDLGMGMQLTNICRDVLEDAQNKRTYLPLVKLNEAGLGIDELSQQGPTPPEATKIVTDYLELADQYYQSALEGMRYIPWRARIAILLAARLYQGIGHKIRYYDYNVLQGRTFLTSFEKIIITIRTLFEFLILALKPKSSHQQKLHAALVGLPGIKESANRGNL